MSFRTVIGLLGCKASNAAPIVNINLIRLKALLFFVEYQLVYSNKLIQQWYKLIKQ